MDKKRGKRSCRNKIIPDRNISTKELKVFFLIFNLIVATIAFSYLVSADTADSNAKAQTFFSALGQTMGFMKTTSSSSPNPIESGGGAASNEFEKAKAEEYKRTTSASPVGETKTTQQGETFQFTGPTTSCNPADPASPCSTTKTPGKTATPGRTPFEPPSDITKLQQGAGGVISDYFHNFMENIIQVGAGALLGGAIGGLAGGKNGIWWGAAAGGGGVLTFQVLRSLKFSPLKAGLIALGVAALIFILTYKKENQKPFEFQCLPWQAPVGGTDCEKCNSMAECSEYTCKSLGQACDLVNKGQKNQKCIWKNPMDTNSPTIEMKSVTKGYKFVPDTTIRPPATGVQILKNQGACVKAFTPLEFLFMTNEPSQCKIDYNLTAYSADAKTGIYDNMGYYVGGDSSFEYNHTETLSLPGPDAINHAANLSGVEIMNDGTYTLYIRCEDANGNFNVNPFSVRFCVDKGPDTTPPEILNYSIPNNSPIQFNRTSITLEIYVNEPADCKWSHEDRGNYDLMEYNMSCSNNIWEMNNQETYTCRTNLTGIKSDYDNAFYFRCLDKPGYPRNDRNPNTVSYQYILIGTRPLNIISFKPGIGDSVTGATDRIPVNVTINTDNGYNNGEALCYYSTTGNEKDYIEFSDTGNSYHTQRQDLIPGNYSYYFKCVDLGGNAAYNSTNFTVVSDMNMPSVIRVVKENGELRITTDKESDCGYSNKDCNFDVDSGIKLSTLDGVTHYSDWSTDKNYYIRCKDNNDNQPDPNVCTIIIRPVNLYEPGNAIVL